MAKYGSNSLTFTWGGTDMSAHTLKINGVSIKSLLEQSTAFGKSWMESLATGMRSMEKLTIEGLYDDTATTGPDAKYSVTAAGPSTSPTTGVITWGGSKTTTFTAFVEQYDRIPVVGSLTKYKVVLAPTGQVTEV